MLIVKVFQMNIFFRTRRRTMDALTKKTNGNGVNELLFVQ